MGYLETVKQPRDPKISIFVPFTRERLVDEFLEMFDGLELPHADCELVFYCDSNSSQLRTTLKQYVYDNSEKYNGAVIYHSGNNPPEEASAYTRRQRITAMKEHSKLFISDSSKYVFSLEDDTFPLDKNCFYTLCDTAKKSNVGYVSGVEPGRWGFKVIGGWRGDDINNLKRFGTIPYMPPETGIEEIDGGGFYCYITRTDLYKSIKYSFSADCFGPDVSYVLDVRRLGYKAYIDWSVVCAHKTYNTALLPDSNCVVAEWFKNDRNHWELQKKPS